MAITDMAMPNMSGDELSVELTKIRPDIPILLCTGFSETMSEEKADCFGIKGFLHKPIVMKDLSHKIGEVLEKNKKMFKICSKCGEKWPDRRSFLNDTNIVLIGYQAHFEKLTLGLLLFNHSCKTTLSLNAGLFTDLYKGVVFKQRATGSDDCPGYCLEEVDLAACSAKCECAYVRETIQIIKNWKDMNEKKVG